MNTTTTRREHDLLGDREVPAARLLGRAHAARAVENFPITGTPISIYPDLVAALACVKQAAALANRELGLLDDERADAIVAACEEIRERRAARPVRGRRDPGRRRHLDQHERQRGHRQPRAGDARPAARATTQHLHPLRPRQPERRAPTTSTRPRSSSRSHLRHPAPARRDGASCARRSRPRPPSSRDVLKMGRTQLQDAVPMTLGQEFSTYAVMLGEDEQRLARGRAC